MTDPISREPVTIWSEGSRLSAEVIRPIEPTQSRPAILLCHGWGGLKGHLASRYAIPFAKAGFVCLVFDYRGWGESDGRMISVAGEPILTVAGQQMVKVNVLRDLVDPVDQVADIRACLAWLSTEAGVDPARIGLWGSSYGGGHVIVVAGADERVKAVVAQIGGFGSPSPSADWIAYQRKRAADKARALIDPPVPQNVDGAPGLQGVPDVARQIFHEPIRAAETLTAPTLFLDAEFEEYAQADTHGYIAEIAKQHVPSERITYPCSHYKVYDEYYEPALDRALDWFDRYLKPTA
jgi:dienelactone hydrolase